MLSLIAPPKGPKLLPNPIRLPRRRRRLLHPTCRTSGSDFTPLFPSSNPTPNKNLPSPPPPPPPGANLDQPFRPPQTPLPNKFRSLDTAERVEILRNRLGRWHEYAPLISSLGYDGFTPSSIEELTGIAGAEQNRLAVAARVRESLLPLLPPDIIPGFDHSSAAELLYELRLLSAEERAAAARYLVDHGADDAKDAQDLARAFKDFPYRYGDDGWECFSGQSPADCLAYTQFRLSREAIATADKIAWLEKALETAETETAKSRINQEMDKVSGKGEDGEDNGVGGLRTVSLPVVRLHYGEVAEASTVVLLPACKASEGAQRVNEAPEECRWEGELGVVTAEKGWGRWVVLPGWATVMGLGGKGGGVAVEFSDARVLPWSTRRWEKEEGVLVVVDRKKRVSKDDDEGPGAGFYLVSSGEEGKLEVERGSKLVEKNSKEVLGEVVVVVRPPIEDDNQIRDEDWD